MWIFSKLGFFSAVKKGAEGGFQIRARVRRDLENLTAAAHLQTEIVESVDTDYRWRIKVNAADFAKVMDALEQSVDYPNFKSEVARHRDQEHKLNALHRIWAIMNDLQRPHFAYADPTPLSSPLKLRGNPRRK